MYPADRVYAIDIETDTAVDGLDPRVARITEISLSTVAGDVVFDDPDEAALLVAFDAGLRNLPAGLVSTWNGTFFDLPFIADRMDVSGANARSQCGMHLMPMPGLVPKYDHLPGHAVGYTATWRSSSPLHLDRHAHLDIMWAYRATAEAHGVTWSLKPVAAAVGVEMVSVDRTKMHELSPSRRRDYVASDSRGTRELTLRVLGANGAIS